MIGSARHGKHNADPRLGSFHARDSRARSRSPRAARIVGDSFLGTVEPHRGCGSRRLSRGGRSGELVHRELRFGTTRNSYTPERIPQRISWHPATKVYRFTPAQTAQQHSGRLPQQHRFDRRPNKPGDQRLGFRLLVRFALVQRVDENVGINGVHATRLWSDVSLLRESGAREAGL